ncbi:MAG: DVUA0089 family protein [Myxococcota bacterium]
MLAALSTACGDADNDGNNDGSPTQPIDGGGDGGDGGGSDGGSGDDGDGGGSGGTDEAEPNDTQADATVFPPDSDVATGRIDAGDDTDYFSFSIDAPARVRIFTENDSEACTGLDTVLDLEGSDGTVLASNDDGGGGLCSRIEHLLFGGVYFIRVRSLFDTTGDYALNLSIDALAAEAEPNDTQTDATLISAETGQIAGSLSSSTDLDYFGFSLDAAGTVSIRTDDGMGGCAVDTFLTLEDGAGNLVESDDDDGVEVCSSIERPLDSGTYRVLVEGFSELSIGPYVLSVSGLD